MLTRAFFLIAPIVYLFTVPNIQTHLLNYCFNAHIESATQWVIFGATAVFCMAYASGFSYRRPQTAKANSPHSRTALATIATVLLAACAIYILVALIRVHERWDSFSLGPSAARFSLIATRSGVTPLGALTAFFLGAPAVLTLFVMIYGHALPYQRFFRAAATIMFAAFAFLVSLEGGRLPYLFALVVIASAVGYHMIRGQSIKTLGIAFLCSLAIIAVAALAFSYREFSTREAASGRTTAVETRANYGDYVGGAPSTSSPSPSSSSQEKKSRSLIVECFYASHTVKSIDRIITKGPDHNLNGFYMMPNYYKFAKILGLVKEPWIAYSDYYGITGMFVGVIGASLIDYSWGAFIFLAIAGLLGGALVSNAISPNAENRASYFLASIVPAGILLFPLTDMTSLSQFQTMIPWLGFVVLTLSLYRYYHSTSKKGGLPNGSHIGSH